MVVSGLSWGIAFAVGLYIAELTLDSENPNLLWAFCEFPGILATIRFAVLNKVHHSPAPAAEPAATD